MTLDGHKKRQKHTKKWRSSRGSFFLFFLSNSDQLIARRPEFQQALVGWYRIHQRKLPWRDSPSLYKTVVSEFMLQQTQVATVLPYFERWQRELPDFASLAAADESKVMKLW